MWTLSLLTALAVVIFAISIALHVWRLPVLRPKARGFDHDLPLISIVVPARNEEATIARCVRSLLAQSYRHLEVIVVDDASSDGTPEILARLEKSDARLRVIQSGPLPAGWAGKNYAVFQGARRARGSWLLFVDADVVLHPGTLKATYGAAEAHGAAAISLWPRHELESFWERAVQPVIIGMHLFGDMVQRFRRPWDLEAGPANGLFILVARGAYEDIGGHQAIRDDVLEDYMLSWRLKQAGYRLLMMNGSEVVKLRMYTSLKSIWEGWSKSTFLGMQRSFLNMLASLVMVYLVTVSPFALLIWSLFFQPNLLLVNLAAAVLLMAVRWHMRAFSGTPLSYYLGYPLGGLVLMGIILNSAYRHTWGRGVTWRGRRYGSDDPTVAK